MHDYNSKNECRRAHSSNGPSPTPTITMDMGYALASTMASTVRCMHSPLLTCMHARLCPQLAGSWERSPRELEHFHCTFTRQSMSRHVMPLHACAALLERHTAVMEINVCRHVHDSITQTDAAVSVPARLL